MIILTYPLGDWERLKCWGNTSCKTQEVEGEHGRKHNKTKEQIKFLGGTQAWRLKFRQADLSNLTAERLAK